MAITYPLALPSSDIRSIVLRMVDTIALQASPFSYQAEVQDFGGQSWEADIELPPMARATAEEWIAFLAKLRGSYGTFLMGDPAGATPRGAFAGTPLVLGAHAAGAAELNLDGLTAATTIKAGDYFNTGSTTTTHLYKVLNDVTANGSGQVTLDIWPRLRTSLADNDAIVKSGAKGLWRLASNMRSWDIGLATMFGVRFTAIEAL